MTRSSTEAEIVAAVEALAIRQYYQCILQEFGTESKIMHYEDNMSCIKWYQQDVIVVIRQTD